MEQLADCFSKLLSQAAKDEETSLILLQSLWPHVVGKEVAKHSRPVKLVDGKLTISVKDPAWDKVLKGMTKIIRETVNKFWGTDLVDRASIFHK